MIKNHDNINTQDSSYENFSTMDDEEFYRLYDKRLAHIITLLRDYLDEYDVITDRQRGLEDNVISLRIVNLLQMGPSYIQRLIHTVLYKRFSIDTETYNELKAIKGEIKKIIKLDDLYKYMYGRKFFDSATQKQFLKEKLDDKEKDIPKSKSGINYTDNLKNLLDHRTEKDSVNNYDSIKTSTDNFYYYKYLLTFFLNNSKKDIIDLSPISYITKAIITLCNHYWDILKLHNKTEEAFDFEQKRYKELNQDYLDSMMKKFRYQNNKQELSADQLLEKYKEIENNVNGGIFELYARYYDNPAALTRELRKENVKQAELNDLYKHLSLLEVIEAKRQALLQQESEAHTNQNNDPGAPIAPKDKHAILKESLVELLALTPPVFTKKNHWFAVYKFCIEEILPKYDCTSFVAYITKMELTTQYPITKDFSKNMSNVVYNKPFSQWSEEEISQCNIRQKRPLREMLQVGLKLKEIYEQKSAVL